MARLFRPYDTDAKAEPEVSDPTPASESPSAASTAKGPRKKEGPTPRRRDAEKARLDRVNPQLSKKEARRRSAEANREARMKAMEARDATPEKELMRDLVDSRFRLGEVLLPSLMLVLALSFLQPYWPSAANVAVITMYSFLVLVLVDLALLWRSYRKLLDQRMPGTSTKGKGLMMYGWNRAIQLRPLRMPKPRLKRGESF